MNKKQSLGFTLTELMITVAIIGILASIAVPSFQDMIERNRLKEAVEGLKSDLMWMRTETIKRSCNLQVSFTPGTGSYSIFRTAGTCDCPAGVNCVDKAVDGSTYTGVTMTNPVVLSNSTTELFDFRRGSVTLANIGNVQLNSTSYHVKAVVSRTGRIRICNIAVGTGLGGYEVC